MIIEVLGSRVIGPFFGVSLFVWTSLIAVTMIALAAGYMIGGILSDRSRSPDILYILIGLAGVFTLAIPYAKISVMEVCMGFGLRGGAFASSAILFAPSLVLLGCVAPMVIKLASQELAGVGRTVGFFYALSTIGSVLGTVLTGFVLVAYMGANNIFFLVGFILVILSTSYFMFFHRKFATAMLVLPFFILPFVAPAHINSKTIDDGTRINVVKRIQSTYGNIKVLDHYSGDMSTRQLVIDGLVQGEVDINNGLSISGYPYLLQYVPVAYNPGGKRCLVVGLGAGIVPSWYMSRGIETDVVDIDPAVVEMAEKYFNYSAGEQVVIEDARYFLGKEEKKYDYIILDVFNGDVTPSHVLSKEAFSMIKSRLSDNGILAMNIAGSLNKDSVMTASLVKTLELVFGKVTIMPFFNANRNDSFGNMVVFAHAADLQKPKQVRIPPWQIHRMVREMVDLVLQQHHASPEHPDAMILTDEYNPMDFYDMKLRENIRKLILENTDWDILLS